MDPAVIRRAVTGELPEPHAPSALLELSSLDPGLGARAQGEWRAASIARGSRRTRSKKRSGCITRQYWSSRLSRPDVCEGTLSVSVSVGGDSCVAGLKGAQRADHWRIVVQARQRGWGVSVCPLRPGCGDDGCLKRTPRSGTRHHDVTGPHRASALEHWTFPLLKPSHEPHARHLLHVISKLPRFLK